jgi:hypothetical protein
MKKNNLNLIKSLFNEYYSNVYLKWRIDNKKAGKDIVGEEYELFRKKYYKSKGLVIANNKNVLNSEVNVDNVIMFNGKIVILEEDKGSYVDGTFLKRAMIDAATIFQKCFEENIESPYFILSSTTKMRNYDSTFNRICLLFNENIKKEIQKKFMYLPLCNHGRVKKSIYFKTEINHFKLCDTLLENQESTIDKIINLSKND